RAYRDAADTVGCGPEYGAYFRCEEGSGECDDLFQAAEACGLQHDRSNLCRRADDHLIGCGIEPYFVPEGHNVVEAGLCDGFPAELCAAQCILDSDCPMLRHAESTPPGWGPNIKACAARCWSLTYGPFPELFGVP